MKARSMAQVRKDRDFEEAKARYEACSSHRWKNAWWELVYDLWQASKELMKKYVLDPVAHTIQEIKKRVRKSKFDDLIICKVKADYEPGTHLCYLCKCYDEQDALVFSKVGTTERTIFKRMKEHLTNYKKYGVHHVIVEAVIDCGNIPCKGLESDLRAKYIRKYPNEYRAEDRFFQVDIPATEVMELAAAYLA